MRSPQTASRSLPLLIASALYLLIALSIGVADVIFIVRYHSRFPFGDYWIWLGKYYERSLGTALLSQYTEHRLVLPGILFFLDQRYFGARNAFLTGCVLVVNLAVIILLTTPLLRDRVVPLAARMTVLGFGVILFFWFAQGGTFIYPFLIAMAMANMWILVALWLFLKATEPAANRLYLWGVILCGCAATFSYGHGILIWILLLVNSILLRLSWKRVAALALAFGITSLLYFRHYFNPFHHGPFAGLSDPGHFIRYVVLIIGLPLFGVEKLDVTFASNTWQYLCSLLAILIASFALIAFFRRRRSEGLIHHSILMLGLGTAILAGLNRVNFPLNQALSGRYLPIPVLFWISLASIVVTALSRFGSRGRVALAVACSGLAAASFATMPSHLIFARYLSDRERNQEVAALSMGVGAADRSAITAELAPDDRLVRIVDSAYMKATGRLSMFSLRDSSFIGTQVRSQFQVEPAGTCLSGLDEVKRLVAPDRGVRLSGWAFDPQLNKTPSEILVTDSTGVILGLGLSHRPRPDVGAFYHNSAMSDSGWVAYMRLPGNGERQLGVFGKFDESKVLCDLTSRLSVLPE